MGQSRDWINILLDNSKNLDKKKELEFLKYLFNRIFWQVLTRQEGEAEETTGCVDPESDQSGWG